MSDKITVGISDMRITRPPSSLITYALGSCVGICIYDPVLKLAGMIHVLLPNMPNSANDKVLKFADSGIPEMIRKMEIFGGVRRRMYAKIAGGAKMFDVPDNSNLGNIGQRNIESVKVVLRAEGIPIRGEDTGSNYARTIWFDSENGELHIKAFGRNELTL